jgi:hypothetical protein
VTIARRDESDTPFGDWIRHHPGLDSIRERLCVTDSDYWIHRYRAHTDKVGERAVDSIMLVEVKTNLRDVPFPQRDTLILVNQLLRRASKRPDSRRRHVVLKGLQPGETRHVRCYGVHLLQLSGTRPNNSEVILWDRQYLTEELLVEILRFDRDPDHPMKPIELRRHHTNRRVSNLVLFPPA